ncbi:MAG: GNAT family N-acetyltransferase [Bacteroidales bacterium]|nr:GNAT family N-acetyltransferase [Bacteroidales bacterium]
MDYKILHVPEKQRFETEQECVVAYVEYQVKGDSFDIVSTQVPQPLEGRGVGTSLVRFAYQYAVDNGLKPKATCPFAAIWLKRHPEYEKEDLLD